jgi:hypothetical protein
MPAELEYNTPPGHLLSCIRLEVGKHTDGAWSTTSPGLPASAASPDSCSTASLKDLIAGGWSPAGPWQEATIGTRRCLCQMLLGYRDGAKVFGGAYLTDETLLKSMEDPLRKITEAKFSPCGSVTLYRYVIGFVVEEQAIQPLPGERDERYDVAPRTGRNDGTRFPSPWSQAGSCSPTSTTAPNTGCG